MKKYLTVWIVMIGSLIGFQVSAVAQSDSQYDGNGAYGAVIKVAGGYQSHGNGGYFGTGNNVGKRC